MYIYNFPPIQTNSNFFLSILYVDKDISCFLSNHSGKKIILNMLNKSVVNLYLIIVI